MRNRITLPLLLVLAACNGAGGGGAENPEAPEMFRRFSDDSSRAEKALTYFEENFLAQAESLEDQALLKFNPCRDNLNWQSTGATTGTVEFSGITFTATNVTNIEKDGDCSYKVSTGDTNGLTSYDFTPDTPIVLPVEYTAIHLVNGGQLRFRTDNSRTEPTTIVSETGAHATINVENTHNSGVSETFYRRMFKTDIQNSISYSIFEVDMNNGDISFEHYNSEAKALLPLSVIEGASFDKDASNVINSTELKYLQVSRYQNNGTNFFYDTKGAIAFILFDRHLTHEEKTLFNCYALYLSTKGGDKSLWSSNYENVCNL